MAQDDPTKSTASSVKSTSTSETTPLLPKNSGPGKRRKWPKSVLYRVLLTGMLVSLSFGVTQVPLIYVFGVMTCDEYYRHHELPPFGTPAYENRCNVHSIQSSTARAVALLGGSTTVFGVANLFITGWMIKVWGIKRTLVIMIFWPAIRNLIQTIGIVMGGGPGIIVVQASQITTIIGGPAGYLLALNSYATEVVRSAERTAALGQLQGCAMLGTAIGYLAGGLLEDWFSDTTPFRVALTMFCLSTVIAMTFLPFIPLSESAEKKASKSLAAFFDPLKMFTPRKWRLPNGVVRREYGVLLLGTGAFMAVFATGYLTVLLQMYATDVFGFGASDNSEIISLMFIIRGMFLTFLFPRIISAGRKWLDKRQEDSTTPESDMDKIDQESNDAIPIDPGLLSPTALPAGEITTTEPEDPLKRTTTGQSTQPDEDETFQFDLFYARCSLLTDGILTSLATLTSKGWHMFVVATVLPMAAGTGSAAKGVMLQMCTNDERTDALSAISLLEMVARLSTVSLFGLIFSGFAEIGRPNLTFLANGAVAVVGFVVLMCARFPPEGAVRYEEFEEEEVDDGE